MPAAVGIGTEHQLPTRSTHFNPLNCFKLNELGEGLNWSSRRGYEWFRGESASKAGPVQSEIERRGLDDITPFPAKGRTSQLRPRLSSSLSSRTLDVARWPLHSLQRSHRRRPQCTRHPLHRRFGSTPQVLIRRSPDPRPTLPPVLRRITTSVNDL